MTSDAGPGNDVVKGYKIPEGNSRRAKYKKKIFAQGKIKWKKKKN